MSTYINVTVDGGGLSERAKAQTNANRQAKLEGDNRQKVRATGTQQRNANRAQQGIGPDGRALYGTPQAQPMRRDEPAAFRASGFYELSLPPTGESAPKTFAAQLKNAKVKPVQFVDQTIAQRHFYNATGGPTGGGYLRCYDGDTYSPRGIAATTADLIFDTSVANAERPDFTVDLWAFLEVPGGNVLQDNLLYAYEQVKTGQLNTDSTPNARMRLEVSYLRNQFDLGPWMLISVKRRFYNSGSSSYILDPVFTYLDYDPSGAVTGASPSEATVSTGGTLTPSYSPVILKNTWNHFALVRKAGVLSFFINGKKLGSFPEYISATTHLEPLYDSGSLLLGATFTNGTGLGGYTLNNGVAKVRVRKKAVMINDFDPVFAP